MKTTDWNSCYSEGWNGLIDPAAYAHPAKYSYSLIQRIISHGIQERFWKPGDILGDPFGGVGLGGICAAYAGLSWVGVELEPRFVALAEHNFALHRQKWETLGAPMPRIIQGDSRKFAELVQAAAVVTSPPFLDARAGTTNSRPGDGTPTGRNGTTQAGVGYGETPGQIDRLPAGSIDSVVTSPPYADVRVTEYRNFSSRFVDSKNASEIREAEYGQTTGQIGALKSGSVDACVTSPPWENQEPSHAQGDETFAAQKQKTGGRGFLDAEYGRSDGQIGEATGETYWQAVSAVYSQVREAVKPGGVCAIVVKAYVKNKQLVPLPDQTWQLLMHLGFEPVERVRAMLTQTTEHTSLFGEKEVKTKKRASFFRRLAEKNGSPPIDWEDVLFVRKPVD